MAPAPPPIIVSQVNQTLNACVLKVRNTERYKAESELCPCFHFPEKKHYLTAGLYYLAVPWLHVFSLNITQTAISIQVCVLCIPSKNGLVRCARHVLCVSFVSGSLILSIALWVSIITIPFYSYGNGESQKVSQGPEVTWLADGRVRTQTPAARF